MRATIFATLLPSAGLALTLTSLRAQAAEGIRQRGLELR